MALPVPRSQASLTRWDPFREFENIYTQMGRLMESSLGSLSQLGANWAPLGDVRETEDAYIVEVDLPGVKQEDINVELMGDELMITGELKETEREVCFATHATCVGSFEYRTALPRDVDADKIEANLHEGVLTVRIPKSEAAKPRRIQITG